MPTSQTNWRWDSDVPNACAGLSSCEYPVHGQKCQTPLDMVYMPSGTNSTQQSAPVSLLCLEHACLAMGLLRPQLYSRITGPACHCLRAGCFDDAVVATPSNQLCASHFLQLLVPRGIRTVLTIQDVASLLGRYQSYQQTTPNHMPGPVVQPLAPEQPAAQTFEQFARDKWNVIERVVDGMTDLDRQKQHNVTMATLQAIDKRMREMYKQKG